MVSGAAATKILTVFAAVTAKNAQLDPSAIPPISSANHAQLEPTLIPLEKPKQIHAPPVHQENTMISLEDTLRLHANHVPLAFTLIN